MHIRWFGDTWGGPINDPLYQIDVPVGTKCLECTGLVTERDRGVVVSCATSVWGGWDLEAGGYRYHVCSYHLLCWLNEVVGGELSHKIISRMTATQRNQLGDDVGEQPAEQAEELEDVKPGGWRTSAPTEEEGNG